MMRRLAMVTLLSLALPLPAMAQTMSDMHHGDSPYTRLNLVESAQRSMKQDELNVTLRVEATAQDAIRLQADINRRMTEALQRVRGITNVRSETGGYFVYEERPQNQPSRWRAQQTLTLISKDSATVLNLSGALQQQGLLLSGMGYRLTPQAARAAEDELTTEALGRLRERANRIADLMEMTIVRIGQVSVGNVLGDQPQPDGMVRMRQAVPMAAPPIAEAGETMVQVRIEALVLLAPKR
jgi:predicted secreted protein